MSIDREFRFLNQSKNSLNDGESTRNSVNKSNSKPSKMVNFVKNYTKYIALAFMLTAGTNEVFKNIFARGVGGEIAMAININGESISNTDNIKHSNLSDGKKDFSEEDIMIFMDDNYEVNCVSGIPLDEERNYAPGTHMTQTTEETFYLTVYRKLSDEDYNDMFKGLKDLEQGNFGNCYFVIALKTLARSKYFDTLMKTSLEKNGNGSFNLYMPLGEPGGKKVTVSSEELKTSTIHGPIGYKILEVGFAKYLLFKEGIIPNTDTKMTKKLMNKMRSGSTGNTMMSLLGQKSFVNECVQDTTTNRFRKIIKGLNDYDPKNLGIMFVTSRVKKGKTDRNFYEVGGERIYYNHAYSVCGIEKDGDIIKDVIMDNPWNNENKIGGSRIKLGIIDFMNSFYMVHIGHVTEDFLKITPTKEQIKVFDTVDRKKL